MKILRKKKSSQLVHFAFLFSSLMTAFTSCHPRENQPHCVKSTTPSCVCVRTSWFVFFLHKKKIKKITRLIKHAINQSIVNDEKNTYGRAFFRFDNVLTVMINPHATDDQIVETGGEAGPRVSLVVQLHVPVNKQTHIHTCHTQLLVNTHERCVTCRRAAARRQHCLWTWLPHTCTPTIPYTQTHTHTHTYTRTTLC